MAEITAMVYTLDSPDAVDRQEILVDHAAQDGRAGNGVVRTGVLETNEDMTRELVVDNRLLCSEEEERTAKMRDIVSNKPQNPKTP